jgi:hypothetical protein
MVFSSDAPALDRFMARAMSSIYEDRVYVCTGTAATDRAGIVSAVTAAEASGSYSVVRFSSGHFDIDTTTITLTECELRGQGPQRTVIHVNGTSGGIICTGKFSDVQYVAGNVRDLAIYTDASFTGAALTLTSTNTDSRVLLQNAMFDGVYLKGSDDTAGSKGLYIVTSGTDSYICSSQIGHLQTYNYEMGVHLLCDGTHSAQGPFINTLGFTGLYIFGSTYGLVLENNSAESNSMVGNEFDRVIVSNPGTTGVVLKCDGDNYVVSNEINLQIMDPATNDITLEADCNGNTFTGEFAMARVCDLGSANLFRPNREVDVESVSGTKGTGVMTLVAGISGDNPKCAIWENPTTSYIMVDSVTLRTSTKSTGAATADIGAGTMTLLEDCEDVWSDGGTGHTTITADEAAKSGTYSNKIVIGADFIAHGADTVIAYENITSVDCSANVGFVAYIMATTATSAGDLEFLLDETANCASPDQVLTIPALTANRWMRVVIPYTIKPSDAARNAVISVGIRYHANLAANTLYIDDCRSIPTDADFVNDTDISTAVVLLSSLTTDAVPILLGPRGTWLSAVVFYPSADTTGLVGEVIINYTVY